MIFLREGVGNYLTFGNTLSLKIEGGDLKIPFHGKGQLYLAHVIEKPNLRIPNPQYFLLFK